MESRVIVQVFSNLDDKDILMKDAMELAEKLGRAYDHIKKEANEQKKMLDGPLYRVMVLGERQHIYVEAICYELIERPVIAPSIALPGRA